FASLCLRASSAISGLQATAARTRGKRLATYAIPSPVPQVRTPRRALPVLTASATGNARRGVLTCGTGLGMAYVANRFPRVRAAVAWSPEIAELARKHNDANVLVLPARFVSEEDGLEILHKWLDTAFEGGRHERRVAKIDS